MSDGFERIINEVLPFAEKLKKRLQDLNKWNTPVRVKCPNPAHTETTYITARLVTSRRSNGALHFGCSGKDCYYRMME